MTFLGNMVSANNISIDLSKIKVVLDWERLKITKRIQSFSGLIGYYKWFMEGFAKLAQLLSKLTKNNVPFKWLDVYEKSF